MLKKLFLHVGPHKTASTSLQELFADNRERLMSSGILYPLADSEHRGQHWPIVRDLATDEELSEIDYFGGEMSLEQIQNEIQTTGLETLLMSSEAFANRNVNWILRLVDALEPTEVELLFSLREPSTWVESIQAQKLNSNLWEHAHSEDFLDHLLTEGLPLIYSRIAEALESDSVQLTLIHMENGRGLSIEKNYSMALGLDFDLPETTPLNARLKPCVLKLLGAFHQILESNKLDSRLVGHFMHYLIPQVSEILGGHRCSIDCLEEISESKSAKVVSGVLQWQAELEVLSSRVIGMPEPCNAVGKRSLALVPEPSDADFARVLKQFPKAYKDLMVVAIRIWDELQLLK